MLFAKNLPVKSFDFVAASKLSKNFILVFFDTPFLKRSAKVKPFFQITKKYFQKTFLSFFLTDL